MQFKDVTDTEYFSKGRRGIVYTGIYKGKKVIIKTKRPESKAMDRIENEGKWLKVLNKHNIGPMLMFCSKDYLIYIFVQGEFIVDYLRHCSREQALAVINDTLYQCYTMDCLGINKEEMHHPLKHIIISRDLPVQIDFERTKITGKPKNVTQFCQFLAHSELNNTLREKGIDLDKDKIKVLSKSYKNDINYGSFQQILDYII